MYSFFLARYIYVFFFNPVNVNKTIVLIKLCHTHLQCVWKWQPYTYSQSKYDDNKTNLPMSLDFPTNI